jgi:outer membrane protein TolC
MTHADKTEFPRREIELRDQQAQLQNGVLQLNSKLWNYIGVNPLSPDDRIWPTTDMTVTVESIDMELAVQIGLANRPELLLYRRARCATKQQLNSARIALAGVSPLLGLAPQPAKCDGPFGILEALKVACREERELAERQAQINRLGWQRDQEVAAEIRQNVATVELRLRQVALAKQSLAEWHARNDELQGRRQSGGATFAEVIGGRLALIQAESDLIEKIAAWKIAIVRLKQSQGLLVGECCH